MKTGKTYSRKPWTKLITPQQFDAIMEEYEAGTPTPDLCAKYRVSRSWLYRERKAWIQRLNPQDNVTCLKAEIAELKQVIVRLAKEKFSSGHSELESQAQAS